MAIAASAALVSPLGGYPYTVSQGYGGPGGHQGIDLAVPVGTPLDAPVAGTIEVPAFDTGGFGNWIIEHGRNGLDYIFGHLSTIGVKTGDVVAPGAIIGATGNTGHSTGPHLHYQVDSGGKPIDPTSQLASPGVPNRPSVGVLAPNTVAGAILTFVQDSRVRLAELVGVGLEGGYGPTYPVGDQGLAGGGAYGAFQIRPGVNSGITAAQAQDPQFAVQYITPRYQDAVNRVPELLWQSNPEAAAAQAAFLAERPALPYAQSQGQAAVDSAYQRATQVLTGQGTGVSNGTAADTGTQATLLSASAPKSGPRILASLDDVLNSGGGLSILNPVTDLKVIVARGAVVAVGLGLGVFGLILIVSSVGDAAGRAQSGDVGQAVKTAKTIGVIAA